MARFTVVGSVAVDDVLELTQPLRRGAHLEGRSAGRRLGGGAANTGIPLVFAGHAVTLVSAVGADPEAEWLLAELAAAGIDTSRVVRREGPSTRSLVLTDPGGERTVVNLHRCREGGPPERMRNVPADALYVRSRELDLAPLLRECLGSALVVAHVPPTSAGARPAHVLVGSESDLREEELRSPWEMGRRIAGDSLRWVVVTRGPRGAEAFGAERRVVAPAPTVAVVDSTGAGDVFAAGLLHALSGGVPMESALRTAVTWGAAAASSPGLPTRARIRELL